MKIFATGDLHGDSRLAEKLAEEAANKKADLVVLCGDLTQADKNHENIIGSFLKKDLKVMFIPGNHDSHALSNFLSELYGVTNLHGQGKIYDNIGLFGVGKANIGLESLSEEEIYYTLTKAHEQIKNAKKKIMVTHVHPANTKMEKLTRYFPGSIGVRKAIEKFQPEIAFCCHVHEAAGLEEKIGKTTVINVCRKAIIKEINP